MQNSFTAINRSADKLFDPLKTRQTFAYLIVQRLVPTRPPIRVVPGSNFSDPTRPIRNGPDPTSTAKYLTRPDPCSPGPYPTRPAKYIDIPDPTQPVDRPDQGTTLLPWQLLLILSQISLAAISTHLLATSSDCTSRCKFT